MEASIRQLRDHSLTAAIDSKESSEGPSRESEDPLKDVQDSSTASAAAPNLRDQNTSEPLGETDVSESSVDGMGALQFTDEENCGFFGMLIFYLYGIVGGTLGANCERAFF